MLLSHVPAAEAAEMGFSQLRDALLALAPLDKKHVATPTVNQAEADFWKRSQGSRIDWSDRVLGFDCGGQQWVSEVAFPTGTRAAPSGADLGYMRDLLTMVLGGGLRPSRAGADRAAVERAQPSADVPRTLERRGRPALLGGHHHVPT